MPVYEYILQKLKDDGAVHASLIDPDPLRQSPRTAGKMAAAAEAAGTDLIFVGGSTAFDQGFVDKTIQKIRENCSLPVVIFPGGITNVSKHADAILFMSLLNSKSPYFIIGQQALGAYAIKMAGLETISTGYLIIEPGATAGWLGDAKLLPRRKPELTAVYALAAQMFGFKMVYLEAGSGAKPAIPPDIIEMTRKIVDIPIIAGGGVDSAEDAAGVIRSGADVIVMGTYVERNFKNPDFREELGGIIRAMKSEGKKRARE
ncbi:MAG: geranylgeranylglyceryl/heptaprenylglyceryl phosphate synthase [Promethearchaeota archaeon]